jgi:hypothetical protein
MTGMTAVIASCGNYSNEDLLYMSGVPSSSQLAVVLPAAPTSVMQAELAQDTHNGISNVNAMLNEVLGLIDNIRSYEPTSRTADSRTWGPFDDANHPGWQWKLAVTRLDTTSFKYELDLQEMAAGSTPVTFLIGNFDLAGGARQGSGGVTAYFADVATAGFPLDPSTMQYDTLSLTYQNYDTPGSPVSATLMLVRTAPDKNGITMGSFSYEILTDGSGQLTFLAAGNIVGGTGTEMVTIHAQWLASGAGMGTQTIEAGADIGLTQTECWDATFEVTYNDKPWSTTEDLNPGEMSAFCPTLPVLP